MWTFNNMPNEGNICSFSVHFIKQKAVAIPAQMKSYFEKSILVDGR